MQNTTSTTRKRITVGLAVVCCLSLLVGSFAFFTDRADATATATAGNIDLVFTDVSDATANKQATQENTDSLVWTDKKITNDDQPIMNPGDSFDMGYKLTNTGGKSIDVKQQLTVTVTDKSGAAMNLTENNAEGNTLAGDYQYFLTCATEDLDLTLDTANSDAAAGNLVYTLPEIILNGTIETEDEGIAQADGQDFDLYLTFERLAKNIFMDSNVSVQLDIQAKQHRNTDSNDWIEWASYKTDVEQIPNT